MKIWHPYTQEAVDAAPITIDRGEGAYLYTRDGRRLIDAISSWWVNLHGHAHPLIAEAIAEQARRLEHVIFAGFTHEPAEELAERLIESSAGFAFTNLLFRQWIDSCRSGPEDRRPVLV